MARTEDIPTTFKAKTWIFRAQAILFGELAFGLIDLGRLRERDEQGPGPSDYASPRARPDFGRPWA